MRKLDKNIKNREQLIEGVAASPGIAIGKVFLLCGDIVKVVPRDIADDEVSIEVEKFKESIDRTILEIESNMKVKNNLDKSIEQIFDAHILILKDPLVFDETIRRIKVEKKNADYNFYNVIEEFEKRLGKSTNEIFRNRVADLRDIKRRVILNIQGSQRKHLSLMNSPSIIVAKELTPSDTISMDRSKVLGFATDLGGRTSHAAIMARSLLVPSVLGLKSISSVVKTGDRIILDGSRGLVIVNPQPATLARYRKLHIDFHEMVQKLGEIRDLPARTRDGKDVELSANIEFPDEVESVQAYGANGVGLYRTEYLFLARSELPSEEEQFREYRKIAEGVYPKTVIIRTMDIGGDKMPDNFRIPPEVNPFLGFRAVRISLEHEELLHTQFRAMLRASSKKNVKILLPMISNLAELKKCKEHLQYCMAQLHQQGVPFDPAIELGVMVETPATAVIADLMAKECSFLSIGTNDLIQYMLAVDRGNANIAHLYRAFEPSILRVIYDTIEKGHQQGVWVGMCGEMAGDPLAAMILLGFGLDEFSVSPVALPMIKEIIRRVEFIEAKNMARKVLEMETADEVESYLKKTLQCKFKDLVF